jgi:hypothetical protein
MRWNHAQMFFLCTIALGVTMFQVFFVPTLHPGPGETTEAVVQHSPDSRKNGSVVASGSSHNSANATSVEAGRPHLVQNNDVPTLPRSIFRATSCTNVSHLANKCSGRDPKGCFTRSLCSAQAGLCGYLFQISDGAGSDKAVAVPLSPLPRGATQSRTMPPLVAVLHPGVFWDNGQLFYATAAASNRTHVNDTSSVRNTRHNHKWHISCPTLDRGTHPLPLLRITGKEPACICSAAAVSSPNDLSRMGTSRLPRIRASPALPSSVPPPSAAESESNQQRSGRLAALGFGVLAGLGVPRVEEQPLRYLHPPYTIVTVKTRQGKDAYRCLRRALNNRGWLVLVGDSNTRELFDALVRTVFPALEFGGADFRKAALVDAHRPWDPHPGKVLQRTSHDPDTDVKPWTDLDVIGTYGADIDAEGGHPNRPGLRLSLRFISSDEKYDQVFANSTLSSVNHVYYKGDARAQTSSAAFQKRVHAPPGERWAGEKDGLERPDLVSPHTGMWHWETMPPDPVAWAQRYENFALRRLKIMGNAYKGPVLWRTTNLPKSTKMSPNKRTVRISARRSLIVNDMIARHIGQHYMILDTVKIALDMWSKYRDNIHLGPVLQEAIVQQMLSMLCDDRGKGKSR